MTKLVKFNKQRGNNDIQISYDGGKNYTKYRAYTICELPDNFGCIGWQYDAEGNITKEGVSSWLKYKGLVYIAK